MAIGLTGCATASSAYRATEVRNEAGSAAAKRESLRVQLDADYQCRDPGTQRVSPNEMKKRIGDWYGRVWSNEEMPGYLPVQPIFTSPQAPYPDKALNGDLAGAVRVLVLIDVSGEVAEALVVCTTEDVFNPAAIATVRGNRYSPSTLHGRPVRDVAYQDVVYYMASSK